MSRAGYRLSAPTPGPPLGLASAGPDDVPGRLECGHRLRTVYARPGGQHLFEYDYVLTFTGTGLLGFVEQAIAPFPTLRLAGAFAAR